MKLATLSIAGRATLCARFGDHYLLASTFAADVPDDLVRFIKAGRRRGLDWEDAQAAALDETWRLM